MKESRAPLIITTLLLVVPMLYVVSYLALVRRDGIIHDPPRQLGGGVIAPSYNIKFYRLDWDLLATIYWPLEQADRKLLPGWWLDWDEWYNRVLTSPQIIDPSA